MTPEEEMMFKAMVGAAQSLGFAAISVYTPGKDEGEDEVRGLFFALTEEDLEEGCRAFLEESEPWS